MNKEILLDQIDFAQARIEEIEREVINKKTEEKGYKELVDSYNKWIDRYDDLIDKLENLDKEDKEWAKLGLESKKLDIEQKRLEIQEELEQDKLNLDRDKFAYDVKKNRWEKPIDVILKIGELGVKVAVPTIGLVGGLAVANLAYVNDADLKLCNGRIWASAKEIMKLMKV